MRQVLTACLLCLFILTAVLATVQAAEDSQAWDDGDLLTPGVFSIDGDYFDEGMNAPYEAGYSPDAADGTLTVVLPLEASAPVEGNVIYCGLDLGSRENSPFLYQNYQSIPVHLKHPDPSSEDFNASLYVAKFVLPLSQGRQNGVYPLGVSIRFRSGSQEQEQLFNIDFSIRDAASAPSGSPDGDGSDPGSDYPGTDPGFSDPGYTEPVST